MSSEDLYREVQCSRCGGTHLAVASFCPHCGYVRSEGWFEKISKIFKTTEQTATSPSPSRLTLSILVSAVMGVYFVYIGITHESLQSIVLGLLSFYFAFRSWFSPPKPTPDRPEVKSVPGRRDVPSENSTEDKFFCENCGTQVPSEAVECPKCGMKFGE